MANENIDTKPTIETVLHRINAIGDRLSDEIHGLRGEIQAVHDKLSGEIQAVRVEIRAVHDKLSGEIQGVRNDIETFRLFVRETLAYVAEEQLEVRTELRNVRRRVGELETKAT